jgi:hypothetical protein
MSESLAVQEEGEAAVEKEMGKPVVSLQSPCDQCDMMKYRK